MNAQTVRWNVFFVVAAVLELAAGAGSAWADTFIRRDGIGGLWTTSEPWGLLEPCFPTNGNCVEPGPPPLLEDRWHVTIGGLVGQNTNVTLTELTLQGVIGSDDASRTMTVEETFTWTSGGLQGPGTGGTLRSLGSATLVGPPDCLVTGSYDIVNEGSATLSGCLFYRGGGTVTNGAMATFTLAGDGSMTWQNALPDFNNANLIQKTGGGVSAIGMRLNNASTGVVQALSGTLRLGSEGVEFGRFTAASGATLEFSGNSDPGYSLDASAFVDGDGTILISGGSVSSNAGWSVGGTTAVSGGGVVHFLVPATTRLAVQSGGTITGDLTIHELFTWDDGVMAGPGTTLVEGVANIVAGGPGGHSLRGRELTLGSGSTVNLLSDAGLATTDGATINNNGGTFNMQGTQVAAGITTFNNHGALVKSGSALSQVQSVFVNTGEVDVTEGELMFTASFTQTSGLTLLSGGRLSAFSAAVPVRFESGRLTGAGQIGASIFNDGILSPGLPIGTLAINMLALGANSVASFDVGGRAQGTEYDFISSPFVMTLDGQLQVQFANGFESSVTDTDEFILLQGVGLPNGAFANAPSGSTLRTTDGFGTFTVFYGAGSPFPEHQVVITNFQP